MAMMWTLSVFSERTLSPTCDLPVNSEGVRTGADRPADGWTSGLLQEEHHAGGVLLLLCGGTPPEDMPRNGSFLPSSTDGSGSASRHADALALVLPF